MLPSTTCRAAGSNQGARQMNQTPRAIRFVLAAGLLAVFAIAGVACAGSEPTATATTIPTPIPTSTQAPTATPVPSPTATVVPSPTPDPELARYMAMIEARDQGPIPTGTFIRGSNDIRLTIGSAGDLALVFGTSQLTHRFTSDEQLLVISVTNTPGGCPSELNVFGWSFNGTELTFAGVGRASCAGLSNTLSEGSWTRP